ncbi:hypothetical protein RIF29_08371 [Crotalaria pallida]|uniref:Uncharacterized protein n=1 Tax=Crotalaria pallida TaxID=3830 RepID=A0AAN9FQP2_CROPI
MNANLGGLFAAALIEDPVWVMNTVPVQAKILVLPKSGLRALVRTGHGAKVTPYVDEEVILQANHTKEEPITSNDT